MRNTHKRRAERVDANQAEIVEALRAAGVAVEIIWKPLDLLVCRRGETFLVDVKAREGEDLNDNQKLFRRSWPGKILVVWSVEDALRKVMS